VCLTAVAAAWLDAPRRVPARDPRGMLEAAPWLDAPGRVPARDSRGMAGGAAAVRLMPAPAAWRAAGSTATAADTISRC